MSKSQRAAELKAQAAQLEVKAAKLEMEAAQNEASCDLKKTALRVAAGVALGAIGIPTL